MPTRHTLAPRLAPPGGLLELAQYEYGEADSSIARPQAREGRNSATGRWTTIHVHSRYQKCLRRALPVGGDIRGDERCSWNKRRLSGASRAGGGPHTPLARRHREMAHLVAWSRRVMAIPTPAAKVLAAASHAPGARATRTAPARLPLLHTSFCRWGGRIGTEIPRQRPDKPSWRFSARGLRCIHGRTRTSKSKSPKLKS